MQSIGNFIQTMTNVLEAIKFQVVVMLDLYNEASPTEKINHSAMPIDKAI